MRRITTRDVRNYCESVGFKLYGEFIKSSVKIDVECPGGHRRLVRFADFKRKASCPICSGVAKITISEIEELLNTRGYKLIEYNGSRNILVQCDKNHNPYITTVPRFRNGHGCRICYKEEKLNRTTRHRIDHVREFFEKEGYKLLSTSYKDNRQLLDVMCQNGHHIKIRFNDFQQGHRCPLDKQSGPEKEIVNFIKTLYNGEIIVGDRSIIINPYTGYNLELDVWLPEINKAIEYNGSYWHNQYIQMKRDEMKIEQCKMKGIELLVITEDRWQPNKYKHFQSIRNFINE